MPHYSTVRQWTMRNGHHSLHSTLPEGKYVILGDLTIDIGKIKCLVTVATDLAKLEERGNYTLSLNDLQIATINPTEKSNGEFAMKAFQEAFERVGGVESVAAIIIDGGSDISERRTAITAGECENKNNR